MIFFTYFIERNFGTISNSFQFFNVLGKVGFNSMQGFFICLSSFASFIRWYIILVEGNSLFQETVYQGTESATLEIIFLN